MLRLTAGPQGGLDDPAAREALLAAVATPYAQQSGGCGAGGLAEWGSARVGCCGLG